MNVIDQQILGILPHEPFAGAVQPDMALPGKTLEAVCSINDRPTDLRPCCLFSDRDKPGYRRAGPRPLSAQTTCIQAWGAPKALRCPMSRPSVAHRHDRRRGRREHRRDRAQWLRACVAAPLRRSAPVWLCSVGLSCNRSYTRALSRSMSKCLTAVSPSISPGPSAGPRSCPPAACRGGWRCRPGRGCRRCRARTPPTA